MPRKTTKGQRIGIRELKATLSQCVRAVKEGASFIVTDHGRPVARILPEGGSLDERVALLRSSGAVQWSGRRLASGGSAVRPKTRRLVSDLIVENRE